MDITLLNALEILKKKNILLSQDLNIDLATNIAFTPNLTEFSESSGDGPLPTLLCYRGVTFDGHDNIEKFRSRFPDGVVVCEDASRVHGLENWILVSSTRKAWSFLCYRASGWEDRQTSVAGVTGTNGKTSSVWFLAEILRLLGEPALSIGTLGICYGDQILATGHTTPDPPTLYKALAKSQKDGARFALMEVTSVAVDQFKVEPITFRSCGWTSFSRDHLDYHGTIDAYFGAKYRFVECARQARAWVHSSIDRNLPTHVRRYGPKTESEIIEGREDLQGADLKLRMAGIGQFSGRLPIFGRYNAENFLLAQLMSFDLTGQVLPAKLWSKLRPIPGRMEPIMGPSDHGPKVFVDYAHTPDALEKALMVLGSLTKGDVWVVFGCGGDRDKGKRILMGQVAARLAQRVILTSDNPRSEPPEQILSEIAAGVPGAEQFVDRELAIRHAIGHAKQADVVLIAGKGHETYQIIGDNVRDFDDRLVAKRCLDNIGVGRPRGRG